jgi:hypothetical protein
MAAFLGSTQLMRLNTAPFEEAFRERLLDCEDLRLAGQAPPVDLSSGALSLNRLIDALLGGAGGPSPASVQLLLAAPDALVAFAGVDFAALSALDRLRE